jgi:ferredoxin
VSRALSLLLLIVLPAAGAMLGYWGGSYLARGDDRYRLAARVWHEEQQQSAERTEESEAFRATGQPVAELFAEARAIERRFRGGGAALGAFLGLVFALKMSAYAVQRRDRIYTIYQPECVACGRCFRACPREHVRLKELETKRGA